MISVILPIYNEEKYLESCIKSVLSQTYQDIEVICVDDGSTDSSKDIIEKYVKADSRVKAIYKKNSGYGNSVNRGIEAASGEYIGIVETDDYIMDYMYEKLYSLTEDGTVDVVKGNFWDCYDQPDGTITKVVNQERENMPDVDRSFTIREYPQILWGHPSIWTGIYRKQFLQANNIHLEEVKGGGWVDNPFFFETLCCAKKIRWTKEPLYCYRKTNAEASSKGYDLAIPFERMIDNLNVLKKHQYNDEEILKFAYARSLMYLIGATQEKNYPERIDYARPYMQQMLGEINPDVIRNDFNLNDQKNYYRYLSPLPTLMQAKAKVLIYNWLPFDNPGGVGGGVTIYCRNLVEALLRYRPDITVYFLSSGWAYDMKKKVPYIRSIPNCFGDRCRSFEIVNSPVPAAVDMLHKNPSVAFESEELKGIFRDFLTENGPFCAIHFNNIEGLSFDVLSLKEELPETRFLFSVHNYVPFCMTGFYYQRNRHCICRPDHTGEDCSRCLRMTEERHFRQEMIQRGIVNIHDGNIIPEDEWVEALGFDRLDQYPSAEVYADFEKKAIAAINTNMDVILAVSDRVRKLSVENGLTAEKIHTDYIGTKIADFQVSCSTAPDDEYFRVVFLGNLLDYEEKGYPFLLDSLEQMDRTYAKDIDLVLTMTTADRDQEVKKRLALFHSVEIIHGYSHRDLPVILKGAHLGLVPVLWEDNLPQIAIEMVAYGVPILCSRAGGASELCTSDQFSFAAGNTKEFIEKLTYLEEHRVALAEYWEHHSSLTTMQKHIEKLQQYYGLPEEEDTTISVEQYGRLLEENQFLYDHIDLSGEQNAEAARLQKELEDTQKQRDYYGYIISETRKSKTYKIGRAITAIPRKIRELMR